MSDNMDEPREERMEDQKEPEGLTQEERAERAPEAMQRELLDIERQMLELTPRLEAKNKEFQQARADFEVDKLRLRLLKERRSALQSVLKSLR
jgi:molecular chaperone GrpE (heat shock protein)